MKYLFTIMLVTSTLAIKAQQFWQTSFELGDTLYPYHFFIDTLSDTNNIWQVGQPQKNIFTSALNGTRAFVTDTVNSYPSNDTSILYIKLPAWVELYPGSNWYGPLYSLQFNYRLDIDPGDYALLETSWDSGQTWSSYMNDSIFTYSESQPLDSSTNGWATFNILGWIGGVLGQTDSIIFRFTFISDSVQSNKDGWMLDNFWFEYWFESVVDVYNNDPFTLYPNPSTGHIKLTSKTGTLTGCIQITNLSGQTVYQTNHIPTGGDLHLPLPDGLYILKYSDEKNTAIKKIIIQH